MNEMKDKISSAAHVQLRLSCYDISFVLLSLISMACFYSVPVVVKI